MHKKATIQIINLLFCWVILLLPFMVYCQDAATVKDRWFFLGVNFSPDRCYTDYVDKNYVSKAGYTTGADFGFQINKQVSIETGVQYSNKGCKTIPIMTVYSSSEPPAVATSIVNLFYYDIPFKVNYSFQKTRLQLVGSLGVALDIFQSSSVKIILVTPTPTFKEREFPSTYEFRKIDFSPIVSLGVKYSIGKKVDLRAEPTFRYQIHNIDPKSNYSIHLWSIGLNVGFYFGL